MPSDVERYFSDYARGFDRLYADLPPVEKLLNRWLRKAIYERYALTFERAGDLTGKRVLDIGSGSGRYAAEFARRGAAEVVGVDVAEPMNQLARQYVTSQGFGDRCRFVRADFMDFTDPRPFDVTIAIGVLDYIEKPVEFVKRVRELTSGRFMASVPGRNLLRMRLRRWRYGLKGVKVLFYERPELERIVRDAGYARFELIRRESSGGGFFLVADN